MSELFTSNIFPVPAHRREHTLDNTYELGLVVLGIVLCNVLVCKGDTVTGRLLIVDNHVFDVLSRMDGQFLLPCSFERGHGPRVLGIPFQWLRDSIPLNELVDGHFTGT